GNPDGSPVDAAPSPTVIISEWSQGTNGGKEWVEFQVLGDDPSATVDLQNAVLSDTNRGMARLQLSGAGFAALPVGTILVVYNGTDPDDGLVPDLNLDPVSGDFTLVIPSTNAAGDFAITATESTSGSNGWGTGAGGAFGNANGGDVPVLMSAESGFFTADNTPVIYTDADAIATFYGILPFNAVTQGTPEAPSVGSSAGGDSFHYLGNDASGITVDANWARDTNNAVTNGNSRTPGEPNAQVIITAADDLDGLNETTQSYAVVLRSQPTAAVTIVVTPIGSVDLGNGAGVDATLTFTPGNWYVPQIVVFTAAEGLFTGSSPLTQVTYTVASENSESRYNSTNGVILSVAGIFPAPETLEPPIEPTPELPPEAPPVTIEQPELPAPVEVPAPVDPPEPSPPLPVLDTDRDGISDDSDLDDDNDGILDVAEEQEDPARDTDDDGILDRLDLDADSDSIPDLYEGLVNDALILALDANGDGQIDLSNAFGANGFADALETAPDSGVVAAVGVGGSGMPTDTDGDNHPDFQDLDADNDGIADITEATTGVGSSDADGDGQVDSTIDTDGDGLTDAVDPDSGGSLPSLPNSDRDEVADFRDLDSDNDGLFDLQEVDLELPDSNGDGQVDGPDLNADGIIDVVDAGEPGGGWLGFAIPSDLDENGISDASEPPTRRPRRSSLRQPTAITGGNGDDILIGFSNPDILNGGAGADILNGGGSPDWLVGGLGNDILNGGTDRDRLWGGRGNDVLNAGDGSDRSNGGAGRDILNGGAGRDRAVGGRGRDTLDGGRGDDILIGGAGRDRLTGGQGSDRFKYRQQRDFGDVVTDFEILKDRIDLRQVSGVRSMDNIILKQQGSDAIVRVAFTGDIKTLAVLEDVNTNALTARHFAL
ncbi:MAG: hypothetical protein WBA10_02685, partial [Elainellaceae cyanobacterium]